MAMKDRLIRGLPFLPAFIWCIVIGVASSANGACIWIEGEKPTKASMNRHPWWYDQVKKEHFSGGDFISNFHESKSGEAEYEFQAPASDRYQQQRATQARLWSRTANDRRARRPGRQRRARRGRQIRAAPYDDRVRHVFGAHRGCQSRWFAAQVVEEHPSAGDVGRKKYRISNRAFKMAKSKRSRASGAIPGL